MTFSNAIDSPCGQAGSSVTLRLMVTALKQLTDRHLGRFGSNEKLAEAIGLTLSGFLRATKIGRMSVESLLQLADVTAENASDVLRDGGQGKWAVVLERLYGPAKPSASPGVRALVLRLEALPDPEPLAEALLLVVAARTAQPTKPAPARDSEVPPALPRAAGDTPRKSGGRSHGVARAVGRRK